MALQIRPLAQPDCGHVSLRAKTIAPAALPGLRDAGRRDGHQVPPVRREHDVFFRRRKPLAGPLDAADFAGDLRGAGDLLRDVCAVVCHHDETLGWRRRGRRNHELGRNCHAGQLSFGRFASTTLQHQPALAIRNGNLSSRRIVAHWFQHVGADGYRADGRGIVRVGSISLLVCCDGRGWILAKFFGGTLKCGRVRLVAGAYRRAPRGYYWQEEHGRAGSAERVNSLADLSCRSWVS